MVQETADLVCWKPGPLRSVERWDFWELGREGAAFMNASIHSWIIRLSQVALLEVKSLSDMLALSLCCLCHASATRKPSPGAEQRLSRCQQHALGLASLQDHRPNKPLLFINYKLVVLSGNDKKQIDTSWSIRLRIPYFKGNPETT